MGIAWAFENAAELFPNRPAILSFTDTNYQGRTHSAQRTVSETTYREANQKANQLAHYLKKQSIHSGDVVALMFENRPELLIVVLALAKLGATAAMLNHSLFGDSLRHRLDLANPKAVIIGEECLTQYMTIDSAYSMTKYLIQDPSIPSVNESISLSYHYIDLDNASLSESITNPVTSAPYSQSNTLFYLYTSGTTGLPKASRLSIGRWMKCYGGLGIATLRLKPNDVLYSPLPLYHGTALVVCWSTAIAAGAAFAIRRHFSASQFWEDTRLFNATVIGYIGELCRYLLNQPCQSSDLVNRVNKMVGNGLRPAIWQSFKRRFGIDEVYELYGASDGNIGMTNFFNLDNTVGCTFARYALVAFNKGSEQPSRNRKGFCHRVPKGAPGLLLSEISKKNPLDGYTQTEKTSAVVIRHVFKKGDAWFNSGDLLREIGFRHLQFVDRLGDTFRWKGENVSTSEVENVVNSYKDITSSAVYGVQIPNTEGRAGMVSLQPDKDVTFNIIRFFQYLNTKLPHYAVPLFVRVTANLAMTDTFKQKKQKLKAEGYANILANDPVYILLPNSNTYVPLTREILEGIDQQIYPF